MAAYAVMFYFRESTGKKGYVVPVAAGGEFGIWGYIQAFEEIRQQVCDAKKSSLINTANKYV